MILRRRRPPSKAPAIVERPARGESAPYFAALVESSCRTSAITEKARASSHDLRPLEHDGRRPIAVGGQFGAEEVEQEPPPSPRTT